MLPRALALVSAPSRPSGRRPGGGRPRWWATTVDTDAMCGTFLLPEATMAGTRGLTRADSRDTQASGDGATESVEPPRRIEEVAIELFYRKVEGPRSLPAGLHNLADGRSHEGSVRSSRLCRTRETG